MRKLKILSVTIAVAVFLYAWGFFLQTVGYSVKSDKIGESLRIVFISDLHNCFYGGKDNSAICKKTEDFNPDIVLFGGDVIDAYGGTENALTLMKEMSEKYPCAYSAGNHEETRNDEKEFFADVSNLGVFVLDGDYCEFEVRSQKIRIYGTIDYYRNTQEYKTDSDCYNILLMHEPQQFEPYNPDFHSFDMILSGHAHGGQWCIPFILEQGLYAPDQGLFPEYTSGKYTYGTTTHIISRGLAKPLRMIFIPRIFNRPELSFIDISKK